jgi:hypothetical protein
MKHLHKARQVLNAPEYALLQKGLKLGTEAPPGTFSPARNTNTGHWNKPKFSLREQAVMRKATMIAPLVLPPLRQPCLEIPLPNLPTERKLLRNKLPKLPKDQRLKSQRQEMIQEKLSSMDKTIESWRSNQRQEKLKNIPKLPF